MLITVFLEPIFVNDRVASNTITIIRKIYEINNNKAWYITPFNDKIHSYFLLSDFIAIKEILYKKIYNGE